MSAKAVWEQWEEGTMNILKMMLLAIVFVLGFTSATKADNDTPDWEEAIMWPETQQICRDLEFVRSNPTDKTKARFFASQLFDLLGKPSDPLRAVTCGRGEGQVSFFFGAEIVKEMNQTMREAGITPAYTSAASPEKIREALRLDMVQQARLLRDNGARATEFETLIQQSAEYRFTPAEVGLSLEEVERAVLLEERRLVTEVELIEGIDREEGEKKPE